MHASLGLPLKRGRAGVEGQPRRCSFFTRPQSLAEDTEVRRLLPAVQRLWWPGPQLWSSMNIMFSSGGMRWTFCGTLLFLSPTRSSRYSFTWKLTTGFSDFSHLGTFFTFTTEAFTPDLMRWTSGWMKSGSVSRLNIDRVGVD